MQKEKLTALGSVAAAIGASICCIGPLVAVLLGTGSLAAASGLQKWRPLFLGVTFVLLAVAWYLTCRRRKAASFREGAAGASKSDNETSKAGLWFGTGFAVAPRSHSS